VVQNIQFRLYKFYIFYAYTQNLCHHSYMRHAYTNVTQIFVR